MGRDKKYEIDHGFTDTLKLSIIRRDHGHCCICGRNDVIDVHHIDGDVSHNDPINLQTLCKGCHVVAHCDKPMKQVFNEFVEICKKKNINPYELLDVLYLPHN